MKKLYATRNGLAISVFFFLFGFFFISPLCSEPLRSFDDIFPHLGENIKRLAFSEEGLIHTFEKKESPVLIPAPDSGIDILNVVMEKTPSHLVEALLVVPHNGKTLDRLDAYNAGRKIRDIKNHFYFSHSKKKNIPVFEETTRIESDKKRNPVDDPPHIMTLPLSETIYLFVKDTTFGNLYVRGNLSTDRYGITYNLTNFAAVRFLIFTVLKAEKFSAVIYLEPVGEGILIYGIAGAYIPDFIANIINISGEIESRLAVLINWITTNLKTVIK